MADCGTKDGSSEGAQKKEHTHFFKFLFIGDSESGKTAIITKFTESDSKPTTIGVDFATKMIDVGGELVKLQLWDTAGQERFRTIVRAYYRGAHGMAIVYKLTDRDSLGRVESWKREIDEYASKDACKFMVGTRLDLETDIKVTKQEAEELAQKLGLENFEICCSSGEDIDAMFEKMVEKLIATKKETQN